jgi:hypothetical protein
MEHAQMDTTTTSPAPRTPRASETEALRRLADLICIHALCARQGCRRRRTCSGKPRQCLARYAPLVPEDARAGTKAMIAGWWADKSFDELIDDAGDEVMALAAWAETVTRLRRAGAA